MFLQKIVVCVLRPWRILPGQNWFLFLFLVPSAICCLLFFCGWFKNQFLNVNCLKKAVTFVRYILDWHQTKITTARVFIGVIIFFSLLVEMSLSVRQRVHFTTSIQSKLVQVYRRQCNYSPQMIFVGLSGVLSHHCLVFSGIATQRYLSLCSIMQRQV